MTKFVDPLSTTGKLVLFRDSHDKSLEPARDLLQNSQKWCQTMQKMGLLVDLQISYEDLRSQLEILKQPDRTGDLSNLSQAVVPMLLSAYKAHRLWKDSRKRPLRKPGAWVQHWLSTFGQFLTSYAGIVEIIKGADQQYGGLAYGTLALLLAIPVYKDQYEEDIKEALDEFSLAFPRLTSLESLYFDESETLKSLVVRVYTEVVLFAQECMGYYHKTSLGRVKATMLKPPRIGVQVKVREIRRLLAEIRWETEVLMQKRITQVREDNQQLKVYINDMCELHNQKQKDERQAELARIRSLVRITDQRAHMDTAQYQKLLERSFSDLVQLSETPCMMTWERFKSDAAVSEWLNSESSCVLLISGRNSPEVNHTTLNWLSYAAILLAQATTSDHGAKYTASAHYYCQTRSIPHPSYQPQFRNVLASWIYQIAERVPKNLGNRLGGIEGLFSNEVWSSDIDEALTAVLEEFVKLLSDLEEECDVNLVIDRIDQCRLDNEDPDANNIVDWLIKLGNKSPRRMRILVISHPIDDKRCTNRPKTMTAIKQGTYKERVGWNQTTDDK